MRCVILSSFLFFLCSPAKAQEDSLRYILRNLYTEVADQKLKKALAEAQALHADNSLNDSLSAKLLYVSDLLAKSTIDNQKILCYNLAVSDKLRELLPQARHIDYAYSLDYLAGSYQRMDQQNDALRLYLEALAIKRKTLGEDHLKYATALNNIAGIYYRGNRYDKALPLYQQELLIKKEKIGENNYDYVNCLISLSWTHHWMGHYDTALSLCQNILITIKKIPKNAVEETNSLMNIARMYHRMGQYDRALQFYDQALTTRNQAFGKEHFRYASALIDVAYFHHSIMGNYDKALQLYEEALVIIERIIEKNDPEKNNFLERLQIMYRLNLSHLGSVNYLMARYNEALHFYRKTLQLFPQRTDGMINLARLYFSMRQTDSAFSLCMQISGILREQELNTLSYAYDLNNLAGLFYNMGKYRDALALFDRYSRITRKIWGKENPDHANGLINLGMAHTALGNDSQAAFLFDEATSITLNYLSRTYAALSEQEKISILKKTSDQFDFFPSLLFVRKTARSADVNKLYENILALKGMVLEDQQAVLNSIRKSGDSRVLQSYYQWNKNKAFVGVQQLLPLAKRVPYLDSLENITNQLEQELSRYSLAFRNQQNNKTISSRDVSKKLRTGQATIEFVRFQLFNKKWTDSILYAALVLLPDDSIARFVPLFEEKQLQRLLRPYAGSTTGHAYTQRLYGAGIGSSSGNSKSLNDSLYRLIWKPLENHLKGVHTIHYAPAGLLHRVAFKALRRNAAHPLINDYRLNQVLSTRSIALETDESQNPLSVSVWGNIDYDRADASSKSADISQIEIFKEMDTTESVFNLYTNDTRGDRSGEWPPLAYAKKEIDAIKKNISKPAISISVVSGGLATEEAFKDLDGKGPHVLHMATHGFFISAKDSKTKSIENNIDNSFTVQQNPMFRSGLVLAGGNHAWKGEQIPANSEDGILTAYEIAQLDLSNIKLLVLTACETALGDLKNANEGVVGLQRAFKLAGVKKMILSLWQVPDEQTMELITLFYNNWLGGQTVGEALHNAQMEIKKKYPPFYWASFILVE